MENIDTAIAAFQENDLQFDFDFDEALIANPQAEEYLFDQHFPAELEQEPPVEGANQPNPNSDAGNAGNGNVNQETATYPSIYDVPNLISSQEPSFDVLLSGLSPITEGSVEQHWDIDDLLNVSETPENNEELLNLPNNDEAENFSLADPPSLDMLLASPPHFLSMEEPVGNSSDPSQPLINKNHPELGSSSESNDPSGLKIASSTDNPGLIGSAHLSSGPNVPPVALELNEQKQAPNVLPVAVGLNEQEQAPNVLPVAVRLDEQQQASNVPPVAVGLHEQKQAPNVPPVAVGLNEQQQSSVAVGLNERQQSSVAGGLNERQAPNLPPVAVGLNDQQQAPQSISFGSPSLLGVYTTPQDPPTRVNLLPRNDDAVPTNDVVPTSDLEHEIDVFNHQTLLHNPTRFGLENEFGNNQVAAGAPASLSNLPSGSNQMAFNLGNNHQVPFYPTSSPVLMTPRGYQMNQHSINSTSNSKGTTLVYHLNQSLISSTFDSLRATLVDHLDPHSINSTSDSLRTALFNHFNQPLISSTSNPMGTSLANHLDQPSINSTSTPLNITMSNRGIILTSSRSQAPQVLPTPNVLTSPASNITMLPPSQPLPVPPTFRQMPLGLRPPRFSAHELTQIGEDPNASLTVPSLINSVQPRANSVLNRTDRELLGRHLPPLPVSSLPTQNDRPAPSIFQQGSHNANNPRRRSNNEELPEPWRPLKRFAGPQPFGINTSGYNGAIYDRRHELLGLPVDPHLRILKELISGKQKNSGNEYQKM